MYALSFDMSIDALKTYYVNAERVSYTKAYSDIKDILYANGFEWVQGSTYLTKSDDLANVVKTILDFKKIDWFRASVRDIRGFKVESWSNFTDLIKKD